MGSLLPLVGTYPILFGAPKSRGPSYSFLGQGTSFVPNTRPTPTSVIPSPTVPPTPNDRYLWGT